QRCSPHPRPASPTRLSPSPGSSPTRTRGLRPPRCPRSSWLSSWPASPPPPSPSPSVPNPPRSRIPPRRNHVPVTLTAAETLQVRQAAERLQRRFDGHLNAETIERFMNESLDTLVVRARTSTWIPLLAERFTRDRLLALVRLESHAATLRPGVLFL